MTGIIALGDSITRGEGASMLDVDCRPWAAWLAGSLNRPLTNLAQNGAKVAEMIAHQLPRVTSSYALAAVYAGVNDVRSPSFDLETYRRELGQLFAGSAARADLLITCTIPLDLDC